VGGWTGEQVITAGGERLRLLETESSDGGPVVLVWGGLGSAPADWDAVLERVDPGLRLAWIEAVDDAEANGTLVRRRAEANGTLVRRRAEANGTLVRRRAEAIRVAARALGLQPPYLLAGHSLGGLHVHGFARLHPALTAGLLLVDPTLPEPSPAAQPSDRSRATTGRPPTWALTAAVAVASRCLRHPVPAAVVAAMARRLFVWSNTAHGRDPLPLARSRRIYGDPALARTLLRDWAGSWDAAEELHRIAADHPLPDVPLTVLTGCRHGRPFPRRDGRWVAAQRALAQQAPHGRFVPVDDAAHLVMLDRPDAVAAALQRLVHDVAHQAPHAAASPSGRSGPDGPPGS
jgi:pimeloyl-ACP methyl ester carboxylesterase